MSKRTEQLTELLAPVVEDLGFVLWGVEYIQGRGAVLRVFIDHADGISVDNCAAVSHEVSGVLDVEDPVLDAYTLEVSSPGIDRPLTRLKDFDMFEGYEVKIETTELIDGQRRFKGMLAGIENNDVLININQGTIGLKFEWLSDAKLVLTDDLIKEMLRQRKAAGTLNETKFDKIETEASEED